MIYIKKERELKKKTKTSVEYYSCRTEHITKNAIQEGWALAHFVQNTKFSFDLKTKQKNRAKGLKGGSGIPVYA